MVITEKLLVEWNGSQKSYYEEKGYRFTKFGDKFEVRFEDIPHSSDKLMYNVTIVEKYFLCK